MKSSLKLRLFGAVAGLVVVGAALFYWRAPLLQAAGDLLVRDDRPDREHPADALVLLMGDETANRAEAACRYYKQGLAKRIVFAEELRRGFVKLGIQPSGAEVHARFLQNCGVPVSALLVLGDCQADSTVDEARCVGAWALSPERPATSLLVVTSWYHSRRAGWLFARLLASRGLKVQVAPAVSDLSTPVGWWHDKFAVLNVVSEYIKWSYWLVRWRGGLDPGA